MRRAYNICGPVSSLVPEYKRSLEGLDVVGAYRPTFALHPIDRTHILGVEFKPHAEPSAIVLADEDRAAAFERVPQPRQIRGCKHAGAGFELS